MGLPSKDQVLKALSEKQFSMIESILYDPSLEQSFYLLHLHLQRLLYSAKNLNYNIDLDKVKKTLEETTPTTRTQTCCFRVIDPSYFLPASSFTEPIPDYFRPFVENKTTYRSHYTAARERFEITGNQEVLLWNERNELTEGSITNFAVLRKLKWITPPLECGLLDGVLRKTLLDQGTIKGVKIVEGKVFKERLQHGEEILLFNSVRGILKGVINICH
ncbi:putative aminodeoxychorismate lyase [Neolecta irregularis DAH-3]|uniref:Putative aminodeoxychorismate lyase n=1 Tax=Neolecta irregularis (strain DAH-3) TaxID=1198029 RepID=A0A1U7LNN8_NEOID|nr:putative aminodeoxychorismate lyase [Neolecta irregularis DAH-3]|eukprot:OLL24249.1 putative aminodeoxychorismate lyase [Neolecta irregularis DAH-3]